MYADGGANIWEQLRLSGEPPIDELADQLGSGPTKAMGLVEYQELGLRKIEYRQSYSEYWNSTINQTATGRPADAFIMPVAPHAAVIPGKYYYYGKSNVLEILTDGFLMAEYPVSHRLLGNHQSSRLHQRRNPGHYSG